MIQHPRRGPWRWLAALVLGLACAAASAQVEPIRTIAFDHLDPDAQGQLPDASSTFALPLRWSTSSSSGLEHARLRVAFMLDAVPTQPWALLFERNTLGGRYLVNGHAVTVIAADDATHRIRWVRPTLVPLDPSLLHPGENTVDIETTIGGGTHLIDGVRVGALTDLAPTAQLDHCLAITWNWIGLATAVLVGLAFAAFALRRSAADAPLIAGMSLAWLLCVTFPAVEMVPAAFYTWLGFGRASAFAAFMVCFVLIIRRTYEIASMRLVWAVMTLAVLGPLPTLGGGSGSGALLASWQLALTAAVALYAAAGFYHRARSGSAAALLPVLVSLGLTLTAVIDALGALGWQILNVEALPFSGTFALLAVASPRIGGFARRIQEAEISRAELESRVKEREQLLKRNYERIRESERVKAEAQERQRIMQDMHDGLGSQLMSSLMLVERGGVSADQFAQILRESIDDMRLAIDAMSADHADLAAALGNLRFRMEPRFRAAGTELSWDARRLPEELGLHSDVVLPILRIVQESLTNALKHSGAKTVRVTLATEGSGDARSLDIRVADNGRGIVEERSGGRGLLNMRTRARKIDGQLQIETGAGVGTIVHLRTRIGPDTSQTRQDMTILNTQAVIEKARHY